MTFYKMTRQTSGRFALGVGVANVVSGWFGKRNLFPGCSRMETLVMWEGNHELRRNLYILYNGG